jgi:hypothetical protein
MYTPSPLNESTSLYLAVESCFRICYFFILGAHQRQPMLSYLGLIILSKKELVFTLGTSGSLKYIVISKRMNTQ